MNNPEENQSFNDEIIVIDGISISNDIIIEDVTKFQDIKFEDIIYNNKLVDDINCDSINIINYCNKYEGYLKYKKLIFIIEKSSALRNFTLDLLMSEMKKTSSVELYTKACEEYRKYNNLLPNQLQSIIDTAWIETTEYNNNIKLEKLRSESLTVKSSMINESIRLSFNDFAQYYYEIGNLYEAQKQYIRCKEYCNTNINQAELLIQNCILLIDLEQYSMIPGYLSKINFNNLPILLQSKIKIITGLNALKEKNYEYVIENFLSVDASLLNKFNHVLPAEDIALYTVLLSFVVFDRKNIKQRIIESKHFKQFLNLLVDFKLLLNKYINKDYGSCIEYINKMKAEWSLDCYLNEHMEYIYNQIIENFIIQYFLPYTSVSLIKMASDLSINIDVLENLLVDLITNCKINAKINNQTLTLIRIDTNISNLTCSNVKILGDKHINELKNGLIRLSVIKHGLQVSVEDINNAEKLNSFAFDRLNNLVNMKSNEYYESVPHRPRSPNIPEDGIDEMEDKD